MSVLLDKDTRVVVSGVTGSEGTFHTRRNIAYGTNVVAGVTPGKGGQRAVDDKVPVFDTVAEAVQEEGANASLIFVPARFAADSIVEAVDAGCSLVVCITEGIPTRDMAEVYPYVRAKGVALIGPNCPGATSPGRASTIAVDELTPVEGLRQRIGHPAARTGRHGASLHTQEFRHPRMR